MSLKKFLDEDKICPHSPTKEEIGSLFNIVKRDISDASVTAISTDRRHATAYNAALQLATIVLYASGYRAKSKVGHHWVTLKLIPDLMGNEMMKTMRYFNECRELRNIIDYESIGIINAREVAELLKEVEKFKAHVMAWLKKHHSKLL